MMKKVFTLLLAMCTMSVAAQSTDKKLVIINSSDSLSEMTVYLPSAKKATGRAIVDCPGGGYTHLAIDHEGHQWAEYFNSRGIAFVVLKYRMPNGDRNIPLTDAYNAIRTVRANAKAWNMNPQDIGIMGFSAGGHLASAVSTHAEEAVRPNFSILFYPVISMNEYETHKGSCVGFLGDKRNDKALQWEWNSATAVKPGTTPPAIVLLASDDNAVPALTNGVTYYTSMIKAGNKCAMMCYPSGGHGFGFKNTFKFHEQMLGDLSRWLETLPVKK